MNKVTQHWLSKWYQRWTASRTKPDPIVSAGCGTSAAARRSFLKTAATASVAAPVVMTSRSSRAADVIIPPSPPTIPWQEELPLQIEPLQPLGALLPEPEETANIGAGECGRAQHQRWGELYYDPDFYEMAAQENPAWSFNPAYPPQSVWGFNGAIPGPTIFARYGKPIICRIHNQLPQDHIGFGSPEINTHLHNAHTPSESDGFPGDFFSPFRAGPTLTGPGYFRDHFYPNVYAGVDEFGGIGDPREALGTLFYHDHTMDSTAPNVYRGLSGFYLLFDDLDSGNERDPNPNALRLPSYPYDYPLMFSDKRFDIDGMLYWDQLNPEGVLGDKVTVNGKIEPVLRVARRKYRLRLLNGGPSRFYELYLVNARNTVQRFTYIANDGNLLPAPVQNQTRVRLMVAERADIVVDFSAYPLGTELYVVNRLVQDSTRKPDKVEAPGTRLLKIIVDRNPPEPDVSRVPSVLRELRPLPSVQELATLPVRRWVFDRKNGLWSVNSRLFNVRSARATVNRDQVEIWELVNASGGWEHPVHIHFEEGRILSKTVDGVPVAIPLHERGRKDIYPLGKNTTLRVLLRFRDFSGKYIMHCHNIIHEDHAMMVRWDIKD